MDHNKENFNFLVLFLLSQNKKEEWNEYRSKALKLTEPVVKELEAYFEDIFGDNIPQYTLSLTTSLYRARQIKNYEWDQVEVNINRLKEDYFKMLLTDSDIKMIEESDSFVSFEMAYFLKSFEQKDLDENQLNKLYEFNKKYSDPRRFYGFPKSKCGVPPKKYRKNGRLNTKMDAYLYLALEKDTAIYEMRPSISSTYSLAKCNPIKELLLVDLRSAQKGIKVDNFIASSLAEKVSDPNTDNDDKFYHITQCLSHFLQNKNYDGIIYTSAIKKDGTNIILFDKKKVNFKSSEIVSIDNIHIDYTTQLPIKKYDME